MVEIREIDSMLLSIRPWEFTSKFPVCPHLFLAPHEKFHYFGMVSLFKERCILLHKIIVKNKIITFRININKVVNIFIRILAHYTKKNNTGKIRKIFL